MGAAMKLLVLACLAAVAATARVSPALSLDEPVKVRSPPLKPRDPASS
jgi:hypothetical protein